MTTVLEAVPATSTPFVGFSKIGRLSRNCVITEKIDGTNGLIYIGEDAEFLVGSKSRWITPQNDNFGFARWAYANREELMKLGPGRHFGEWWGLGIQRGYGLKEKRFSLFNTYRWSDELGQRPSCCGVVPILYEGMFSTDVWETLSDLALNGSKAAPGFLYPEGIIIYHESARTYFKKTIEKDEQPKGEN